MTDVKRYKKHGEILGRVLVAAQDGDYVKYADYAALQARVAELERERDEADDLAKAAFADGASNNIWLAEAAHRVKLLETRAEEAETRMAELEAALPPLLRELIQEQSEGEWDDATIEKDVAKFTKAIRALIAQEEPTT